MDKFGIFNLLNSFLNFYSDNKQNKNANGNNSSSQNDAQNAPFDLSSLLSSLLRPNANPINKNDTSEQNNFVQNSAPAAPTPKAQNLPPKLQAQMLSTMLSHDKFVEKVQKTNLIQK